MLMSVRIRPSLPAGFVVRFRCGDRHPSAFKQSVGAEDIEHAVRNAVAIEHLEDDLCLYLGPGRDGSLFEVITLQRDAERGEVVIHAHDDACEVPPAAARRR